MTASPRRLILAGLALMLSARVADAQRIRGVVVLSDSTTPAAGVIVEVRDDHGRIVARGLSGESGAFQLDLPSAGDFDVRALRVGFHPSIGPRLTIAAGETAVSRLVMTGLPVSLAGVAVRTSRQCRINADTGLLISHLWLEARTALESTQLTSPDGTVMAHWSVADRSTDVRGTLVLSEQTVDQASPSSHPFRSLPADSLARVGYVSYDHSADIFTAPDAEVLLSDSFARTHCFQVVRTHPQHPEWIGVAFSPTQSRPGFSDIEGTLWLDRSSAELHRLDYRYTGLPRQVDNADPSGWVEFMHLSSGPWFVSRWSIRMPRATRYNNNDWTSGAFERDRVGASRLVVEAVQIRDGRVKSIAQNNGTLLFATAEPAVSSAAADSLEPNTTLCGGLSSGSPYSLLYGRVLDSSNRPVPNAAITIQWQDNSSCGMDGACNFDIHRYAATANETGTWWFCGARQGYPITVTAQLERKFYRRLTTQIEIDKRVAKLDIPVAWP